MSKSKRRVPPKVWIAGTIAGGFLVGVFAMIVVALAQAIGWVAIFATMGFVAVTVALIWAGNVLMDWDWERR